MYSLITQRTLRGSPWGRVGRAVLTCWLGVVAVTAQAMYKCTDAAGATSYQERPCAADQKAQTITPAVPARAVTQPVAQGKAGQRSMTVDDFMRAPTPGLENAAACVKAYDAELSRQYEKWDGKAGAVRDPADTRKLAEMRAACPEISQLSSVSAEERAANIERTRQVNVRERDNLQRDLRALREDCARVGLTPPPGVRTLPRTAESCAKETKGLEVALEAVLQRLK